ncbi:MAG: hypothetical protein [Olavius algarvensis Gamma 1 endosymbiont]|nr:MAG: hypothetical protein [Olavius algarvensis Gamma 1 endosymbiont]
MQAGHVPAFHQAENDQPFTLRDQKGIDGIRPLSGADNRIANRVVPLDNFMIYNDIIRLDRPD